MSTSSAKAYALNYDYDLFFSYATIDDQVRLPDRAETRWVTYFQETLVRAVDRKLGRNGSVKVFCERKELASSNARLTPELRNVLDRTAIFVAIVSRSYLHPECWCNLERKHFLASLGGTSQELGAKRRIWIILIDEVPSAQWREAFFPDAKTHVFYEKDTDERVRLPTPGTDAKADQRFFDRVEAIAEAIVVRLKEMKLRQENVLPYEAPRVVEPAVEPSKVYISYVRDDRDWAEWIAAAIERAGYEPILEAWHYRHGENFVLWKARALEETNITIAVLSETYLKSEYIQLEWAAALAQDPTCEKGKVIPVRVTPCSPQGLLASVRYIDLVDLSEQDAERTLVDGLKPTRKPTQPTPFPKKPAGPGMPSVFPQNPSSVSPGSISKDHDAATRIFICYRRDDSSGHAGRLFDALAKKFGESKIFMDVAGIEPGADFVEVIERSVASCQILLAVIGRNWLAYRGSKRKRRLDDPNDYVRLEIQAALKKGIRIIPILVQGAQMPGVDNLPEDIRKLTRKQGFDLRDNRWNDDVTAFISALQRIRSAS